MGVRADLVQENRDLKRKLQNRKKGSSRATRKFLRKHSGAIVIVAVVLFIVYGVGFRLIGATTWHPPVDPGLVLVAFVVAAFGALAYALLQALKK